MEAAEAFSEIVRKFPTNGKDLNHFGSSGCYSKAAMLSFFLKQYHYHERATRLGRQRKVSNKNSGSEKTAFVGREHDLLKGLYFFECWVEYDDGLYVFHE